ncbi:hypothetical protein RQY88_004408 [Vibrio vulnificus]|nr:hypothetical protein [Vibrio vulnificus]ELH9603067.1 hypothetical protein [Vibrio vulnificus]ELH9617416.1 hypothetical protein [Vibrio vulnificus]
MNRENIVTGVIYIVMTLLLISFGILIGNYHESGFAVNLISSIGAISSFISLLVMWWIFSQWKYQDLASKRHSIYQDALSIVIKSSVSANNLIETKKHKLWFYLQCKKPIMHIGQDLEMDSSVLEERNKFYYINQELICNNELMIAMSSTSLDLDKECFITLYSNFRNTIRILSFSNLDYFNDKVFKLNINTKGVSVDKMPYSIRRIINKWNAKISDDGGHDIYINPDNLDKLYDEFKDIINEQRGQLIQAVRVELQNLKLPHQV